MFPFKWMGSLADKLHVSNKKPQRICKNCEAYDHENKRCKIFILHQNQKFFVPTDPEDTCFYEADDFPEDALTNDVHSVRLWEEDQKVKIEYPRGLFPEPSGVSH